MLGLHTDSHIAESQSGKNILLQPIEKLQIVVVAVVIVIIIIILFFFFLERVY